MNANLGLLVCKNCKKNFNRKNNSLVCDTCNLKYKIIHEIPQFQKDEIFWSEPGITEETMNEILDELEHRDWNEVLSRHESEAVSRHYRFISNLERAEWHTILKLKPESIILDLGAGMGTICHALSSHYKYIFAVEPVMVRCEFMRHRFRQESAKNVTILRTDSTNLPFPDGFFDHIVLNGVLEWIPYSYKNLRPDQAQVQVLRKLYKLLKPHGSISIGIENRLNYAFFLGLPDCHIAIKFVTVLPRFLADFICKKKIGDIYRPYIYSWKGLKKILVDAGFKHIEIYSSLPCYNDPKHTVNLKFKSELYEKFIWPTNNRISLMLKKALNYFDILKYFGYAFRAVGVK